MLWLNVWNKVAIISGVVRIYFPDANIEIMLIADENK